MWFYLYLVSSNDCLDFWKPLVYWDFYMVCMDPFCFDCEQAYFNQTNLTARFWQIAKAKKPIMHMVSLLVSRTNSIDFMEDNFYLIRQHTSACLTTSDLRQVCGNDRNLISFKFVLRTLLDSFLVTLAKCSRLPSILH